LASRKTAIPDSSPRPGRPRSESVHRAILKTTAKMMETMPVRAITIGGIAKKAGVGKPTIYRWWDSKCALVMDAFLERMNTNDITDDDTNIVSALTQHLEYTITQLRGREGKIVAEIVGEGQSDPHILEEFHARFFNTLLAPARALIQTGKQSGIIDHNLDTDLALDLLYGPIYYRLLVGHQPLDQHFAKALPQRVIAALQIQPAPTK
jgi:AcrR family transcriptional regulator